MTFFFSFILGGGLLIGTRAAEKVNCKELREREGGRERERAHSHGNGTVVGDFNLDMSSNLGNTPPTGKLVQIEGERYQPCI